MKCIICMGKLPLQEVVCSECQRQKIAFAEWVLTNGLDSLVSPREHYFFHCFRAGAAYAARQVELGGSGE